MPKIRQLILVVGDIILAYGALFLTVLIGFSQSFSSTILIQHIKPFTLLYVFWFLILFTFGLYDLKFIQPNMGLTVRVAEAGALQFAVGITFFYLLPIFGITPKTNLIINLIIFNGFVYLWRRAFYSLFSSHNLKKVAVLGKTPLSITLINTIQKHPQLGYQFKKFIKQNTPLSLQIRKIDILIVAKDFLRNKKIYTALYQVIPSGIEIMDLARAYEVILQKIPIDFLNEIWFLQNLREGEKKIYDKIKRALDIFFSLIILILTSPLWLIFAILIKNEDNGPVFYKQKRVGKNKEEFWLWKFRTMKEDAEKTGPKWAQENDSRVTKIGKMLRRTHLDELPQMINVLRGDISLVGPRPERPAFVKQLEKEIPHYHLRHIIKPGFTGWAQIKQFGKYARSIKDSHEKFQYDLYYIKNRSLLLDITCLLKTFYLFLNPKT